MATLSTPWKKILYVSLGLILIVFVVFASALLYVHSQTNQDIYHYSQINEIPGKPVAIVFGASVNPQTKLPSDILADRIVTAVDLYKAGKVEKIIMSGDNRVTHYNEPIIMQHYARILKIPEEDIVLDYAGRRTYDTCYRAKEIFQVDEAILVTQEYHLYRAIYTCKALGLDVIGVSSNRQSYKGQFYYNIREIAATLAALLDVHLIHPKPILGDKEDIYEEEVILPDSQAS